MSLLLLLAVPVWSQKVELTRIAAEPKTPMVLKAAFSEDGTRAAFGVQNPTAPLGQTFSIVSGESTLESGSGVMGPVLSSDGKIVAYGIQKNRGKWMVVAGDWRSEEYEGLLGIALSRGGKRLAFAARSGTKWSVVVDGKKGDAFDLAMDPLFSPDGTVLAYSAGIGRADPVFPGVLEGEWFVVVDGTRGASFEEIRDVVLSGDGKSFAYAGRRKGRWIPVFNGKESGSYEAVRHPTLSRDGRVAGFAVIKEGKAHALIGSREGPAWGSVGEIALSPDGKLFAYFASDKPGQGFPSRGGFEGFVILGSEKKGPEFKDLRALALGPDGTQVAFASGTSVHAGTAVHQGYFPVTQPAFSGDGRSVSLVVLKQGVYYRAVVAVK